MILSNFHTHSTFSDGKDLPKVCVDEALRLGMSAIGISDHAPLPFRNSFAIPTGRYTAYCDEIRRLKAEYIDMIEVFLGLEIDYIPGMLDDFSPLVKEGNLDYVIGSVHLIGETSEEKLWFTDGPNPITYDEGLQQFFGGDIRKAVKTFYNQTNQMIETQRIDIIGHFDKVKMHNQNRYFTEDENWYKHLVRETLQLIKSKALVVEINTRGIYKKRSTDFFPSQWVMHEMAQMQIPVLVSSDAHLASELNLLFNEAIQSLKKSGYRTVMTLSQNGWQECEIQ